MNDFATLIDALDQCTGTARKVALIADHLRAGESHDSAWSVLLLMGEKRRRLITGRRLREILQACDAIPDWLFDDCQSHVGDSAETLALLWPQLKGSVPVQAVNDRLNAWIETIATNPPLHWWMEELLPELALLEPTTQSAALLTIWSSVPDERHFLFNKLLTGGFRIGVARGLVVK
ncbi:ATP-dependent DNA ligase, partial [Pseudomonas sp. HMWF031]